MNVSAARSAQVPAVVLVDATEVEVEVVGAAVVGVVGVVLEVVAFVEVVATLAVPQAQSNVKTPTIAIHGRPLDTDESSDGPDMLRGVPGGLSICVSGIRSSTVARSERLTEDYRARRLL